MKIYDVLGIGFGPANIAVAIVLEEHGWSGSVGFLEKSREPDWHPNMLVDGADIQNNPLRDLVTPRNPRSPYTFINYLHGEGRLFDFLNLGVEFPLRKDYARYVAWVARHFDRWVRYGEAAVRIDVVDDADACAEGSPLYRVVGSSDCEYFARSLVVAPGRSPNIPKAFARHLGERVFHLCEFLPRLEALRETSGRDDLRIGVIGGSQSAIEIVLYLACEMPKARVFNVMRSFGYSLKDTSQFVERVYFPEFIDYYYSLPFENRSRLFHDLRRTNYSAADGDVIRALYLKLYEQRLDGDERILLKCNYAVERVKAGDRGVTLALREVNKGGRENLTLDAVVLATGYRNLGDGEDDERFPPILDGVASRLRMAEGGGLHLERDYGLCARSEGDRLPPLYLNGLCESSHGFGDSGSISLLSIRSFEIVSSLLSLIGANRSDPTRDRTTERSVSRLGEIESSPRPIGGTSV